MGFGSFTAHTVCPFLVHGCPLMSDASGGEGGIGGVGGFSNPYSFASSIGFSTLISGIGGGAGDSLVCENAAVENSSSMMRCRLIFTRFIIKIFYVMQH